MKKIDFFFNKWMLFSFLIFGISTISMAQNPDPATGIISVEDDDAAVLKARVTGYGSTDSTAIKLSNWSVLAGTEFIIENTVSEQGLKIYSNSDLLGNTTDSITIFKPDGDVEMHMGDLEVAENIDVEGFSALGEMAPNIKMAYYTFITPAAQGATVSLLHGLDVDDIISLTGIVDADFGLEIAPNSASFPGYEYSLYLNPTGIFIRNHNTNSANILSRPIRILITYKD